MTQNAAMLRTEGSTNGASRMPDLKVDPDKTWLSIRLAWSLGAMAVLVAVAVTRFEYRMSASEEKGEELVRVLKEVRDEVRRGFADAVLVRQMQGWIEHFRALNNEKFPGLRTPDLPR